MNLFDGAEAGGQGTGPYTRGSTGSSVVGGRKGTGATEQAPRGRGNQYTRGYPWGEWVGRGSGLLRYGVDYVCQDHGMAAQLRLAAKRLGKTVEVSIRPGQVRYRFKDRKPGGYKRGRKPGTKGSAECVAAWAG